MTTRRRRQSLARDRRPVLVTRETAGTRMFGWALGMDPVLALGWLRRVTHLNLVKIIEITVEEGHSKGSRRSDVVVRARDAAGDERTIHIEGKAGETLTDAQAAAEAAACDVLVVLATTQVHLSARPRNAYFTTFAAAARAFAENPALHLVLSELAAATARLESPRQHAREALRAGLDDPAVAAALAARGADLPAVRTARGESVVLEGHHVLAKRGWVHCELQPKERGRVVAKVLLACNRRVIRDAAKGQRATTIAYPGRLARLWDDPQVRQQLQKVSSQFSPERYLGGVIAADPERVALVAAGIPVSRLFGYRMTGVNEKHPWLAYGVQLEAPSTDPAAVRRLLLDALDLMDSLAGAGAPVPAGTVATRAS